MIDLNRKEENRFDRVWFRNYDNNINNNNEGEGDQLKMERRSYCEKRYVKGETLFVVSLD